MYKLRLNKILFRSFLPVFLWTGFSMADPKIGLYSGIDVGRIESGYDVGESYNLKRLFLIRNYVNVGFDNQLNAANSISMGVGGVLWKPYEKLNDAPYQKTLAFGPGISHAFMQTKFSDHLSLSYGYLSYKYNKKAKNLGEYLFRTEAYPTIIYTGGWNWMNDAAYHTVGAQLTWKSSDQSLTSDVVLFAEYFNAPIFDITPAVITRWSPLTAFTLGGAVSFHRLITPSRDVSKKLSHNYTYYKDLNVPGRQNSASYSMADFSDVALDTTWALGDELTQAEIKAALYSKGDPVLMGIFGINSPNDVVIIERSADSASPGFVFTGLREDLQLMVDSSILNDPATQANMRSVKFDPSATKLMGFFDLDIGSMLGFDSQEMGAFNLYGEVAVLGLTNYPIFYTKTSQRIAKMLGVSIPLKFPGFNLLDNFSLEVEHLSNPNSESIENITKNLEMVPHQDDRFDNTTGTLITAAETQDDFKWSMNAHRKFGGNFSIFLQVANDHFRLKDGETTTPTDIPITNKSKHWYWLTRIEWSL